MTHQQIAVRADLDKLDKVTTYRTLATLKEAGLLHTVLGADATARYCANTAAPGCPGGHAHFQCLECGEMRCVRDQPLPRISMNEVVIVKAKQLVAFGLCARCAKTAARNASRRRGAGQEVAR